MNACGLFLQQRISANVRAAIGATSVLWLWVRLYGIESEEEEGDSLCQGVC